MSAKKKAPKLSAASRGFPPITLECSRIEVTERPRGKSGCWFEVICTQRDGVEIAFRAPSMTVKKLP